MQDRQRLEREKLEILLKSMESRAHDINSLMEVLVACMTFQDLDPVPYLKAALRDYLEFDKRSGEGS